MLNPILANRFPEDVELVTLPEVFFRIKETIEDPDSEMADVAREVARDPALTARFLQIANSPLYCRAAPIETVSRALNLLGTQLAHDIVLAASVASAFSKLDCGAFDVGSFWKSCIARGVFAKAAAAEIGILDNEHVFIEGLLSQIGIMALFQALPEQAATAQREAQETGRALHAVQAESLGFDYCGVGAMLAARWRLPEALQVVIAEHQTPERATEFRTEVACVHIAARLADGAEGDFLVAPAALEITGLDEGSVVLLRDHARQELDASLSVLGNLTAA